MAKPGQKQPGGFSEAEKEAMAQRSKELRAQAKGERKRQRGEEALREIIASMPESDRQLAQRIHGIVIGEAPQLWPKTWYGMPAYANDEDQVICFFQGAEKFESRYATFGFNDAATLDAGSVWPVAFAVKEITDREEGLFRSLVRKAVGADG